MMNLHHKIAGEEAVKIVGNVRLRFGCDAIAVEEPIEIRDGIYDVQSIGAFTFLGGEGSVIRHVESIGRFCMIGPSCQIGLVQHPADHVSAHVVFEHESFQQFPSEHTRAHWEVNCDLIEKAKAVAARGKRNNRIVIGNDVWIGQGAVILRGCKIGDGAIVGAGAVVTKDVEPYSIVGGVPAKRIRWRFPRHVRGKLIELRWWHYGLDAMKRVDVTTPEKAVKDIARNIAHGAVPFTGKVSVIDREKLSGRQ